MMVGRLLSLDIPKKRSISDQFLPVANYCSFPKKKLNRFPAPHMDFWMEFPDSRSLLRLVNCAFKVPNSSSPSCQIRTSLATGKVVRLQDWISILWSSKWKCNCQDAQKFSWKKMNSYWTAGQPDEGFEFGCLKCRGDFPGVAYGWPLNLCLIKRFVHVALCNTLVESVPVDFGSTWGRQHRLLCETSIWVLTF